MRDKMVIYLFSALNRYRHTFRAAICGAEAVTPWSTSISDIAFMKKTRPVAFISVFMDFHTSICIMEMLVVATG